MTHVVALLLTAFLAQSGASSAGPWISLFDGKSMDAWRIFKTDKAPKMCDVPGAPGIGPKTAERIIAYRQKNGPFKKTEELMKVQGIGEKSFLRLKAQVTVSAKPVAEELEAQEETILAELNGVQGSPVDLGGYYWPELEKVTSVMRPSATLNAIVDKLSV